MQAGNSSTFLSPPRRIPITEGKLVGLENDLVTMLDNLTGHPMQLKVFPIIGMAGIGKTTFCKKLYDHPLVLHHFYVRAWVTVSQQYQVREMLLSILCCVTNISNEIYEKRDEELREQVYRSLKGKRYLIVLDDMWDTQVWDDLKRTIFCSGLITFLNTMSLSEFRNHHATHACRAWLRKLVTQVGALKWLNIGLAQLVESLVANCWLARSKRGVGLCSSNEGLGFIALGVEGIASGWLHRAAKTSRSLQWKDNKLSRINRCWSLFSRLMVTGKAFRFWQSDIANVRGAAKLRNHSGNSVILGQLRISRLRNAVACLIPSGRNSIRGQLIMATLLRSRKIPRIVSLCNSSSFLSPPRRTPIAEGKLVGLEKDLETMLHNLTGHPLQLKVFPIIGMAGIGKTTFCKKLYDNPLVKHHFYVRAWVTVSQQYQVRETLFSILHWVTEIPNEIYERRDEQLREQVYRSLKGSLVLGEADHCRNILALSYNHLLDHLKAGFLYMGIFPEDYEISVKKLRWTNGTKESAAVDKHLHNLRRLSFQSNFLKYINTTSSQHIRSMYFEKLSLSDPSGYLGMNFILLKVLDIMNIHLRIFPFEITYLTLLKFMALTIVNDFSMDYLITVRGLQILIVDCEWDGYLARILWDMLELRHFHLKKSCLSYSQTVSKPEDAELPLRVLNNLQSLSAIRPVNCTRKVFLSMPNVKKLGIHQTEEDYPFRGWFEQLVHLQELETLKYVFDNPFAYPNLKPDRLPSWESFPQS
ncbi:UNVERIFIED_CONTAM: putative disease resistance protein [Sesamum latifolium]|uniref:Disease resistance protein n=1 Tax=Sesamum latifolium TaxID=2727402 RepID=A0AAW2V0U0_9LAMI